MIDKVKKFFGIEGIKVEMSVNEPTSLKEGLVHGTLSIEGLRSELITEVNFELYEIYTTGYFKSKKTEQFLVVEISIPLNLIISAGEKRVQPFTIPFEPIKSTIDRWGEKNILTKGITSIAKLSKGVKSHYQLNAVVKSKGTMLHPKTSKIFVAK